MSKKRNRNRSARRSNERSGVSRTLLEVALDLLELNREDMRVMDLSPAAREALDLDPVRFRRRTDATIRLQDRYQAVLEKDGVEVRDATRLAWAVQSLGMHPGADIIDLEHNTTLAAAIYILDNLPEDRCEEAARHLPMDTETDTVPILDLNHEESSIRSMHHIIRHRNDDCTGKEHLAGRLPRTYMDAYTTAGSNSRMCHPVTDSWRSLIYSPGTASMMPSGSLSAHTMMSWRVCTGVTASSGSGNGCCSPLSINSTKLREPCSAQISGTVTRSKTHSGSPRPAIAWMRSRSLLSTITGIISSGWPSTPISASSNRNPLPCHRNCMPSPCAWAG